MRFSSSTKFLALLAVVAGLVAGCGDGDSTSSSTSATSADGTVTAPGTGTSAEDLDPIDLSTPEGTVQKLWSFYRAADIPGIVSMYDPKVEKVVGKDVLAGAIRSQTGTFAGGLEEIQSVEAGDGGALVSWSRKVPDSTPVYGSYFLRDGGKDGWIVVYDSALSTGISTFVRASEQAKLDPKKEVASPEANAAATQAQAAYDTAFGVGASG